ncbi:MAG TPA: ClbS/DfsB family four-helix bundle protein [Ktedonobacterales bacterium]|jgi:hypothetical protein
MNEQPMTKSTLLTMLGDNFALFLRTLAQISYEQMTQPLAENQWAGKDILSHLTAWNYRLVGWLQAAGRNETPAIPEPDATWDDEDRLNAKTFAETHQLPLADVCKAFERSFQQVLERVQALSDEQLTDPRRYDWLKGKPLWRRITRGPGYGHFHAHLADLLQRVDQRAWYRPNPGILSLYTGAYHHSDLGTLTVWLEDGQLRLNRSWNTPGEALCLPLEQHRFAYHEGGLLSFQAARDGSVSAVECWSYLLQRVQA